MNNLSMTPAANSMRCRQWKRIKNHLKFRDGSLERSYGHEEVCQVLRLPAGCGVMGNRDTWRLQRRTTLPGYGDSDLTRQQRPTPAPAKEWVFITTASTILSTCCCGKGRVRWRQRVLRHQTDTKCKVWFHRLPESDPGQVFHPLTQQLATYNSIHARH